MVIRKLAEELMVRVYYPISAIVSLDENGKCLAVRIFDTMFAKTYLEIHRDAAQVYLLSNHPEGYEEPYPQDLENYAELNRIAAGIQIRFAITGEDVGYREIDLPA